MSTSSSSSIPHLLQEVHHFVALLVCQGLVSHDILTLHHYTCMFHSNWDYLINQHSHIYLIQCVGCSVSEDGPSPWIIRWRFKYPATPDMTFVCFAECRAADKYSVQNGSDCCCLTTDFNFLLLW